MTDSTGGQSDEISAPFSSPTSWWLASGLVLVAIGVLAVVFGWSSYQDSGEFSAELQRIADRQTGKLWWVAAGAFVTIIGILLAAVSAVAKGVALAAPSSGVTD